MPPTAAACCVIERTCCVGLFACQLAAWVTSQAVALAVSMTGSRHQGETPSSVTQQHNGLVEGILCGYWRNERRVSQMRPGAPPSRASML